MEKQINADTIEKKIADSAVNLGIDIISLKDSTYGKGTRDHITGKYFEVKYSGDDAKALEYAGMGIKNSMARSLFECKLEGFTALSGKEFFYLLPKANDDSNMGNKTTLHTSIIEGASPYGKKVIIVNHNDFYLSDPFRLEELAKTSLDGNGKIAYPEKYFRMLYDMKDDVNTFVLDEPLEAAKLHKVNDVLNYIENKSGSTLKFPFAWAAFGGDEDAWNFLTSYKSFFNDNNDLTLRNSGITILPPEFKPGKVDGNNSPRAVFLSWNPGTINGYLGRLDTPGSFYGTKYSR